MLRTLSRLNRDYNPLIRQREEDTFNKALEEPVLNKDFREVVFNKDFKFLEEKITEFKDDLFILGIFIILVFAFYQWKKRSRNQHDNFIFTSSNDCTTFKNEVPEELLHKLLHLHSLLSILKKEGSFKSWLYNFFSIFPCNFIQRLKPNSTIKLHQNNNLVGEKYWNEVDSGIQDCSKALNTWMYLASISQKFTDTADKSIQVNEELVFQLLKNGFEDTSIKPPTPEQVEEFCSIPPVRDHQQRELMARHRKFSLEQSTYARRSPTDMPLIEVPSSSLDGNTLNIQIEFDRRVLLGKLSK